MGIRLFSSSSYDTEKYPQGPTAPNPNPLNYEIIGSEQYANYLLVEVRYPDCTTFEGRKILVYKGINIGHLKRQKSIDPHFSTSEKFHSPIARFVPTEEGIAMARRFCNYLREAAGFDRMMKE